MVHVLLQSYRVDKQIHHPLNIIVIIIKSLNQQTTHKAISIMQQSTFHYHILNTTKYYEEIKILVSREIKDFKKRKTLLHERQSWHELIEISEQN